MPVIVSPPTQQFTVVKHGAGMGIRRPSLGSRIIDAQGRDGTTGAKVNVLGCFFSAAGVAEAKLSVVVPSPTVQRPVVVNGARELVSRLVHVVVPLQVAVPVAPVGAVGQRIVVHVVAAMVGHGIHGVAVERGILVVDAAVGEGDDVVLAG